MDECPWKSRQIPWGTAATFARYSLDAHSAFYPRMARSRPGTMGLGRWSGRLARLAGSSTGHLPLVMNGQRTPSGDVLRRLHEALFAPTQAELVAPVELKVMAWKKDDRKGVVVKGAGGPGGGAIRTGGRVPEGAEVEYAYRAGYDSQGQVSVTHVVDERGYSAMLAKPERVMEEGQQLH